MKKIFIIILLFCSLLTFGQEENYIWLIGSNNMLDFRQPTSLSDQYPKVRQTDTAITTNNVVFSDNLGVLFYTNANTLFTPDEIISFYDQYSINRPLSIYIQGNGSIFDVYILFLYYDNINNNYLLFAITAQYDTTLTVIDTTEIQNSSSLIADFADINNYHFITHQVSNNNFIFGRIESITSTNIDTIPHGYPFPSEINEGYMKVSPNGYLLALTTPETNSLKVYNLDLLNTTLSDIYETTDISFNAIEFSHNSNFLYAATENEIYQLNLQNYTLVQIGTSANPITNMQLAPDGKIYVAKEGDIYLGAIENPEIAGIGCFYNDTAIELPTPSNGTLTYSHPDIYQQSPVFVSYPDTIYVNDYATFEMNSLNDFDSIRWYIDGVYQTTSNTSCNYIFSDVGTHTITTKIYNPSPALDSISITRHILVQKYPYILNNDTIICDTNNYFLIRSNLPAGSTDFRVWYFPNGNFDSTNIVDITVNQPGEYILKVYDQSGTNLLGIDTCTVFLIEPELFVDDSIFYENEEIYITTDVKQTPYDTIMLDDIYFSWAINNNPVLEGYGFNFLDTVFDSDDDYRLLVEISTNKCNFSIDTTFTINPEVVIESNFLFPHDTTICDTTNYITLSVPYSTSEYDIEWQYNGMSISYDSTYTTKKPGKYEVYIYNIGIDQLVGYDTAFIHYLYCDNLSVDLEINGNNADGYACDTMQTFEFSLNITPFESCSGIEDYFYVWDFGNGNTQTGYNLLETSQQYIQGGNYDISVYIYDSGDCEHVISRHVFVNENTSDTAHIDLSENTEHISINFNDYPVFDEPYLINNYFTSTRIKNIFPYNPLIDSLYVTGATTETTASTNDILLFVAGSYKGNVKIDLITPDGKVINAINASSDTIMYLFGRQAVIYENLSSSVPKTLFFNDQGKDFYDYNDNYFANSYYSPDEITFYDENYYYVPSELYLFNDYSELENTPINGKWKIQITIDDFYGRLNSWGLIFNKNYFTTKIKPDSLSCIDQFGNQYTMYNNTIEILNSGVTKYNLDCDAYYNATKCTVKKHLIITVPSIPNVFTPNNDGINDTWICASADINAHVIIIDKLGRIVADYYTADKPEGWDGNYNNKPLPSDSYWYIITINNNQPVKGVVTIVR